MAVFKCKMCGGSLEITEGMTVCECEYCGTKQTLPKSGNDVATNLFNRANNLRMKCEFDKAQEIYEKIVSTQIEDAEAYWGLVLCKYGIEYVEDPATFRKIPTCHRTQLESVLTDVDYQSALEHASPEQKLLYVAEAKEIDRLQKDILAIVRKEEPFDVFICYKETDESGRRTQDSVIANDIYHQLTQEGFKVFYAAITLEDKLGQEYEPYIFAALSSAKVMLVVGTKPEYLNAVWVKNEWSRFLKLMKQDRKKLLIPCYRDMDAYDLPEEFSHLQAQDMSKIGFINDVVRGIKKVLLDSKPKQTVVKETVVTTGNANTAPLLKRAFLFLEDGDWNSADEYCEKVLDLDPECAQAYLGKLMAELKVNKVEKLSEKWDGISQYDHYKKAYRFGDEAFQKQLSDYNNQGIYNGAVNAMNCAKTDVEFSRARSIFEQLGDFSDAKAYAAQCEESAQNFTYKKIISSMNAANSEKEYLAVAEAFEKISGFEDAAAKAKECREKAEIARKQAIYDQAKNLKRRNKIIIGSVSGAAAVVIASVVLLNQVIVPNVKYNDAIELYNNGSYVEAIKVFEELDGYKDSNDYVEPYLSDLSEIRAQLPVDTVSTEDYHTVGLKSDGKVVAVGNNVAVGDNEDDQCDVSDWSDIVAVSAGFDHTVGLKYDGTVVAVGDNYCGQCDVDSWTDIVAVSAGGNYTVGLKSDGTVVAVGINGDGQCDVSDWSDIVAVSAGGYYTVGLKSDGTVVAVGYNDDGRCDVSDWSDIVAVSAGDYNTVGLKSDGTVVAVGDNEYGQCDVSDWSGIKTENN